jgi:1,2-diacylglycerol 3-beta-glucosyltransferase
VKPARTLSTVAQLPGLLSGLYLLGLLAASRRAPARLPDARGEAHFTVIVPAHDEAETIGPTLESLLAVEYPRDRYRVLVVADNCTDDTAEVCRAHGVDVVERRDPGLRGKGYALRWTFDQLPRDTDAVAIVDADCIVSPNILAAYERRLLQGAPAMQVCNLTSNPEDSAHAALRNGSFLLHCVVRPMGKERLGLSTGLVGTGMCFARSTLDEVPWEAFTLAEDREYHLALVAAGKRVHFVEEASVSSWLPPSYVGGEGQAMRWDSGRLRLARRSGGELLRSGFETRDPVRVEAALDVVVPPQALLAGINIAGAGVALLLRERRATALAMAAMASQAAFVILGLLRIDAPPAVWRGIRDVPLFLVRRLRSLAQMGAGQGPATWVRSSREERREA